MVFVSNRIVFLEKEFLKEGANTYKIELGKIQEVEGPTHTELNLIKKLNLEPVERPLKRFNRVSC